MKYFLFIIPLLFISCTKEKVKPSVSSTFEGTELPSQESWNSTIFFTDSGKTKAILTTGHLRVYEKSNETLLDSGLKVDFYNDQEQKTSTLTSKKGRVDDMTNNLYAQDSVVAVNDSGVVVRTDEMIWRDKEKKITSDKFVTITSPKERIEGYGFESDQHLQNYVIYNITYITSRDSI
jgi:lipopolysaccharide export system protein LptC